MYALLLFGLLAADPTSTTLRGVVTDDQDKPLSGVLVAVQIGYDHQATDKTTTTDEAGQFELPAVSRVETDSRVQVLALKHGYAAGVKFVGSTELLGEKLVFKLAPAKTLTLDILNPAGQPVTGAEALALTLIQGDVEDGQWAGGLLPAVLREFPFVSDAAGKLRLDVLPEDTYFALEISAPGFGRQRDLWQLEDLQHPLRLRPVGSLAGTLTPPAGESPEGLRVNIYVSRADDPHFIGWGAATADAAGKFLVPAIAAGNAVVGVELDLSKPIRPGPRQNVVVEVGKLAELELALSPVVEVTGSVVDQADGAPIAGAKVGVRNFTSHQEYQILTTDEKGVYRARMGAGTIGADAVEIPPPYYLGRRNRVSATSSEDLAAVKLDPIRVPRGTRREGVVVDAVGQPVAGAWVTAIWLEEQDQAITQGSRTAQADADGRFIFDAVSSRVEIYVRAEADEQAGMEYTTVGIDNQEPLKLTVSKTGAAIVTGRIVDERGQPLAGARVRIHGGYRRPFDDPRFKPEHELKWSLTTDADGRFATKQPLSRTVEQPSPLRRFQEAGYDTTISAPGRLQQRLRTVVGAGSPFVMPDITLKREVNVNGLVIDRAGKPIAGAAVQADGMEEYLPAQATTDTAGRFTLMSVHPDANFLFARHADYIFTGAAIPRDGTEVKLVLARPAEAAADPPLVPRLPAPMEKLAALRVLLPRLWDNLDPKVLDLDRRTKILCAMAPHDPPWVLARLPQITSANRQIRVLSALGQFEDAVNVAAGLRSADERSSAYISLAAETKAPVRARELLGEAVVESRTIIDPTRRMNVQVSAVRALFDLGEHEAAAKLSREQLPEIEKLEAGYRRSFLAETVALFDVDLALKLCEEPPEDAVMVPVRGRHGNIAELLAARDPARAEAIVKSLTERHQYRYIAPVCYHMAPVDLPRARRIADEALPAHQDPKPYAYAMMAKAIADHDKPTARELLRHGFELLPSRSSGRGDSRRTFVQALVLAHISETVDPASTREYVWRTVEMSGGAQLQPTTERDAEEKFRADGQLAVLLFRYALHTEIAARLVAPLYTTDKLKPQQMREGVFPVAMALADPAQAAAWLDRYVATAKGDELRYIPQPWELMAPAVAGDDAIFWETLHRHVLHHWWPDMEDF